MTSGSLFISLLSLSVLTSCQAGAREDGSTEKSVLPAATTEEPDSAPSPEPEVTQPKLQIPTPEPLPIQAPRPEPVILETLPEGFVSAQSADGESGRGGWQVVGPLDEVEFANAEGCANVLRGISRDFPTSHVDFQAGGGGLISGIVESAIGEDRKPVFAGEMLQGTSISGQESFDQWYRNVEDINSPFVIDIWLEPVDDLFVFDSNAFFPLKEQGYALESCQNCPGQSDGFHFTTELHTRFEYKGEEIFNFRGDDDVWVYINGILAVDLGGVHGAEAQDVNLDEFALIADLVIGETYPLDLFQAERQTVGSNFRIETTLDFSDCGEILEADQPLR